MIKGISFLLKLVHTDCAAGVMAYAGIAETAENCPGGDVISDRRFVFRSSQPTAILPLAVLQEYCLQSVSSA